MRNVTNMKVIYLKGLLFLLIGIISSIIILIDHPSIKVALLLALAVWAFARSYYFAFYVIEHYVDAGYRFSGLCSFVRYAWHKNRENP